MMRRRAAAARVVLALATSGVASAQTDAGASALPADPHAPDPAPTEPSAAPADFPKALTPQQRAPENLQGWLRERNRRHPALAERPALVAPATPAPDLPAPEASAPERAIDGYKRRLQSFDEGGVTVLSNRHAPPPPPLARVRSAAAAPVRAPVTVVSEQEPEVSSRTEIRSLRTNQLQARRMPSEQGLGWPVFAVPVAAIGLTLLWLRKRRMPD
jgi:hypothetical protein